MGSSPMIDRTNNFDTLRFIAALAVVWSHAFSATLGRRKWEPVMVLSDGQTTLGTIGVAVFFIISGYLITKSFERSRSAWRFAKARILRLMPGLLTVVLLCSLVLGPLITGLALSEYFGSWQVYRYIILNGGLLGYTGPLPGVFTDNPVQSVNSPLWTLRYEAYCYVLIFGLGVFGLLNRYATLVLYLGGLTFLAFDGPYEIPDFMEWDHEVDLTTKFLAGAVLYHWRPRLNGAAALGCLGISLLALVAGGFWLVLPSVFAYLVIYAALGLPRVPNLARYGDLSYGIYIYGWPVKQLIIQFGLASTWYAVGALATVITLALAFLSWHVIEKVALSYKDRELPGEQPVRAWLEQRLGALQAALAPAPKAGDK